MGKGKKKRHCIYMKLLKICTLFISIIFFEVATAQERHIAKIAVVDVESILENSIAVTGIRKAINELSENIQKEILQQEKELKKRHQELLDLQKTLSPEKFDSLVLQFNKNTSKVQKNIHLKKIALEQAHSQAREVVHQKISTIISDLAKKRNFNIVLPSSQILHVTTELNITPEVISKLNESLTEVPINYRKFLKN
jgi:Skp family chaperone for outer membrane proteins